MLVLSRKVNEQITIGPDVVLEVIQIKGNIVRLGIVAPREVPVYRAELLERAALENAKIKGVSGVVANELKVT